MGCLWLLVGLHTLLRGVCVYGCCGFVLVWMLIIGCLFSLFVFTGGWLFCLLWLWLIVVCAVFGAFVLIVLVALRWCLLCYGLVCVDCLIA